MGQLNIGSPKLFLSIFFGDYFPLVVFDFMYHCHYQILLKLVNALKSYQKLTGDSISNFCNVFYTLAVIFINTFLRSPRNRKTFNTLRFGNLDIVFRSSWWGFHFLLHSFNKSIFPFRSAPKNLIIFTHSTFFATKERGCVLVSN